MATNSFPSFNDSRSVNVVSPTTNLIEKCSPDVYVERCTERTAFDVVLTILLIFIAVIGVSGNVLTLLSLVVTRALRDLLKQTAVLVGVLAASDLVLCGIGVPLYTANVIVGYAPPFSNNAVVCHAVELLCWGWSNVSIWLLFCIALMRMMATLYPVWHRSYMANTSAAWTMVVLCYIISFVPYALGPIAHLYWVQPEHPGTGLCYPNVYRAGDSYSERIFRAYQILDAVTHCWVPLVAGLLCYVAIYVRMARKKMSLANNAIGDSRAVRVKRSKVDIMPSVAMVSLAEMKSKTTVHKQTSRSDKIKVLVFNFLCNILLTSPAMFIWGLGYAGEVAVFSPFVSKATTVLYFCSFPMNPVVYATLSRDFRRIYADTLRRVFCRKLNSLGNGGFHHQTHHTIN